jgi:hypothetical protein
MQTSPAKEAMDNNFAARVRRVEAQQDVMAALYRYAHSIDYGDEAEWVDCFMPEGVFELQLMNGGGQRLLASVPTGRATPRGVRIEGREALAHFVANHTHAPDVFHKHCVMNPLIRLDPANEAATVSSYYLRADVGRYSFGRYLDRLVRCEDGRWRLIERIAQIECPAP